MAPEQVRRENADRRADVFSLGVVLYELLTDTKPFRGDSLAEIRDAVLHQDPPLASKVDPSVPKALAVIAARAMAKDPEQRFRSARSFARELRQWIDDNPSGPEGEKATPAAELREPPRRRLGAVVGAVCAAAVLGALAAWGVLARSSPAPAPGEGAAAVEAHAPATPKLEAAPLPAAGIDAAASPVVPAATPGAVDPAATLPAPAAPVLEHAAAAPLDSTPAPTAASTNTSPAKPPPAAPTATAPTTAREGAKDKRAREARERDARDNEARVAAMRLAAPATGTVKIAISPWGLVEVDGTSSGVAPPITELTLAAGRHQIVVRNGDYPPYTAQIDVSAGQTLALRHKFGS